MSRTFEIKTVIALNDKLSAPLEKVNSGMKKAFKPFRELYNLSAKLSKELGIPKVGKAWGNVSKSIGKVGSEIKSLGTQISVMAGVASAAIMGIAWKTANIGDAAAKNAAKIGISTKAWTELEYAGEMSGVNSDAMRGSMTRLNKTIFDAAAGNKQAQYWFKAAGVSIKDQNGKLRSADDILGDVAKKFADPNFTSGPKRAALAMGLFGKSGAELIPLLNSGKDGIDEMRREAEELGITFTDLEGKQAEAFGDSMTRVQKAITGVIVTIGKQLLPTLTEWADYLKGLIVAHRELVGTKVKEWLELFKKNLPAIQERLKKLWDEVSKFAKKIDDLVVSFGGWGEILPKIGIALAALKFVPLISAVAGLAKNVILLGSAFSGVLIRSLTLVGVGLKSLVVFLVANPIVLAVAAIAGAAYLIYRNWNKIGPWFGKLWTGIKKIFWSAIDGIISVLSAFGKALYTVGATIISGLWEGLKAGANVISGWFKTAWNWWGDVFTSIGQTLYGAGAAVLSALWNGVKKDYAAGVAWFKGAWRWLAEVFIPIGQKLYNVGTDIITELWAGIKVIASTLQGWFSTAWNFLKDTFASIGEALYGVGAAVLRRLWDGLTRVAAEVKSWFAGAWEFLKDTFIPVGEKLYDIGSSLLNSLWDGMKAAYTAVSDWFSGLFSSLAEALLPDLATSATRVTDAFDTSFLGGLIALAKELNPVLWIAKALDSVVEYVFGVKLSDAGAAVINSLWDGLKNGWAKVKEWFDKALDSLIGFLPDWGKKALGFKVEVPAPEMQKIDVPQPEAVNLAVNQPEIPGIEIPQPELPSLFSSINSLVDLGKKALGIKADVAVPEIPELKIRPPEMPALMTPQVAMPDPTIAAPTLELAPPAIGILDSIGAGLDNVGSGLKSTWSAIGNFASELWGSKPQPLEPGERPANPGTEGQPEPQSQALALVQSRAKREQHTMTGHVAVDFNNAPPGAKFRHDENTSVKVQRNNESFSDFMLRGPNHLGTS